MSSQPRLSFGGQPSNKVSQQTVAELKIPIVAATSNIPLAFHDRLSLQLEAFFQILNLQQNTTQHPERLLAYLHAKWCSSPNVEE